MARPALGRGLGELLNGTKIPERPAYLTPEKPRVDPGLRALLREGDDATIRPHDFGFLKWPLLAADLLLCLMATLLVWQNPGGAQIAVGAAAVLLGAWLGCLAFWLEER